MKLQLETKLSTASFTAVLEALESINKPLGDLCTHLWHVSRAPNPPLAVGATLAALLQDELLPDPSQRLIAIYILYDLIVTRTPPHAGTGAIERLLNSPLTVILFELIERGDARPPEQLFLSHLLSHSQSDANDLPVPGQISQAAAITLWSALEGALRSGASVPKLNMSSLRRLWTERHPDPPRPAAALPPVSAVVADPDAYGMSDPALLADDLGAVVTLEDFTPAFVRMPPPFLPIGADCTELRCIDPEPLHELVWDPDMGMKGERGSELRDLIARALRSPIPEQQQQRVLAQLEADPKLLHLCGLTPQQLPDLVQKNSRLATEILLKLVSSNQMPQYFSALVNMDMTMHSMEVVNNLTSTVQLPAEFVHTYISNCIRSCANIPDKYGRIRMVRFVCVFLKRLIKNNIIEGMQDLHIEVQAFCMEYSRIREVADLYRLLKMHGAQQ